MNESRFILAMVLAVAVLIGYPYLQKKYNISNPKKEMIRKEKPVEGKGTGEEMPVKTTGEETSVNRSTDNSEINLTPDKVAGEILVVVDTPLYKATLSSFGGSVKKWALKKYKARLKAESPPLDMIPSSGAGYSFVTSFLRDGRREYVKLYPQKKHLKLSPNESGQISFSGRSSDGLRIEKNYKFNGSTYMVDSELIIHNGKKKSSETIGTLLAIFSTPPKRKTYHRGMIVRTGDGVKRIKPAKDKGPHTGKPHWLGLEDKYFLSAYIPEKSDEITWEAQNHKGSDMTASIAQALNLSPGAIKSIKYKTYMGPKEYDQLKSYHLFLEDSIEFGMFAFMARPMLAVLNFFYKYVANYGVAIILMTILIKVLFYPLTKQSLKSMKDMQTLQPQMAAIKKKYKGDKQRVNKEVMELYKKHKVNPLSGCLPMILQVPVFIALYEVLYVAIELRQAPFLWWIKDLAAPDTLIVLPKALPFLSGSAFGPLPLLMGATMFIQQKMTPTPMEASQARMMTFMPIIFTFMFLNFPTGLVLYWLVNNVLQIMQQYYIHRSA